jgi:HEPN domain-containing protein
LRKALQDQAILEILVDDYTISNDAVGFHAQQAAEKLLKALLVLYQQDYPRSHDLNILISLLARINIFLPSELQALADLSPMATIYRYEDLPSDSQVSRHEWRDWIEILRKLVENSIASN